MATAVHAKKFAQAFNSVTICSSSYSLDISADASETTTSCDSAKRFLQGKYGATASDSGPADFADNGGDETYFTNVVGGGAQASTWSPDGDSSTGATNPEYQYNSFLTSYSISADVGNAVQYSASHQVDNTITRAVA